MLEQGLLRVPVHSTDDTVLLDEGAGAGRRFCEITGNFRLSSVSIDRSSSLSDDAAKPDCLRTWCNIPCMPVYFLLVDVRRKDTPADSSCWALRICRCGNEEFGDAFDEVG